MTLAPGEASRTTPPPVSIASHPELLDDVLEWDVASWAPAVALWDRTLSDGAFGQAALDVGARGGGLSLYLGLCGYRVSYLDLTAPTRVVYERLDRHGVTDRVAFVQGDGTRLPFEDASFHVVAFKSLLGSVARQGGVSGQQQVLQEIHRVLKPGGRLLFAENAAASALHRWLRKRFVPWGRDWRYVSPDEVRAWLAPFATCEVHTCGAVAAFGRSERQRRVLAGIDRLIMPLVPESSRYVIYGYAQK